MFDLFCVKINTFITHNLALQIKKKRYILIQSSKISYNEWAQVIYIFLYFGLLTSLSKCKYTLKYGFCKKSLRKDATLTSSTVVYRYPFVMKKVFSWSELHLSEVISYKIHTLVVHIYITYRFRCFMQYLMLTLLLLRTIQSYKQYLDKWYILTQSLKIPYNELALYNITFIGYMDLLTSLSKCKYTLVACT